MTIKQIRQERGLSQEQLAQMAGISPRTLQRIEGGATPSAETLKCLASALDLQFDDLRKDMDMAQDIAAPAGHAEYTEEEVQEARDHVEGLKGFYMHAGVMVMSVIIIYVVNLLVSPWYMWAHWAALGCGISVAIHALVLFGDSSGTWERRQIEKRLKR